MAERRIDALDSVRAVALLATMLFHLGLARGGWVGIDIFFALSGYLITGLLLAERTRTGRVSLPTFWRRRALRLMPALLVFLLVVSIAWGSFARPGASMRGDVFATLGYVANWHFIHSDQSYFASFDVSPLRHAWTLAVEEQFYVLWPLAFLAIARLGSRGRVAVVGGLASLSTWWMIDVTADSSQLSRAYQGSDTRAVALLLGCLAALLVDQTGERGVRQIRRWSGVLVAAPGVVFVVVFALLDDQAVWFYRLGGFTVLAVLAAMLVVGAANLPTDGIWQLLTAAPLVHVGVVSYSVYLWHWPIDLWLEGTDLSRPVIVVLACSLAFVIGEASYRLIEAPMRHSTLRTPALVGSTAVFAIAIAGAAVAIPTAQAVRLPQASSGTVVARPEAPAASTVTSTSTSTSTTTTTTAASSPSVATPASTPPPPTSPPPTPPPLTSAPPTLPPRPLGVLLLGDSVAWVMSAPPSDTPLAVDTVWHARCDLIGDRVVIGGRIDRADRHCDEWPADWAEALTATSPDAIVVVLGLRQLFDPVIDGQRLVVGSPDWTAAYRQAVRHALDIIRASSSAPVLWFNVPCYRWAAARTAGEEHDPSRLQVVNDVLRSELAVDPRVTVVDYARRVCNGPDPLGDLRPDGAHPSPDVALDLWRWLTPMIDQAVLAAQ